MTDIVKSSWTEHDPIELKVEYVPNKLGKFLGLKPLAPRFIKAPGFAYEATFKIQGRYTVDISVPAPIKLGIKETWAGFFTRISQVEEDIPHEKKMEVIWEAIIRDTRKNIMPQIGTANETNY